MITFIRSTDFLPIKAAATSSARFSFDSMKTICLFLLFALLAVVYTAPAPAPAPGRNDPQVSILRYNNDQDLEALQRAIIAQYESKYSGPTVIHTPRVANAVNPLAANFNV
ncbi:uncharacterized protein LOC132787748 [Drosophila nasuta]|uniref:uncharacterized protein LOC132787748 n=1 Tax=Drosophila nasuta TaxID=42062 RepID=UPI00295E24D1|nr:uncharacterized protein LOC132787748 [Drosophila nasuta]